MTPGNPIVARLLLGHQLQQLRQAAGISGQAAGAALRATGSKISRVEAGHVPVRGRDVLDLLRLYKMNDATVRAELLALADLSQGQGWWDAYADTPPPVRRALELEAAANLLTVWDPLAVPAVLQTRAYAEAASVLGGAWRAALQPDELARRQELLQYPEGPRVWALIDEVVLRRPAAALPAMRAQVAYLADMAARPDITIQVVPLGVAHPLGVAPPFTVTRFGPEELGDRVNIELLTGIVTIERRSDVDVYRHLITQLAATIPQPEESVHILLDIGHDLGKGAGLISGSAVGSEGTNPPRGRLPV
jgi:hypothetical protein